MTDNLDRLRARDEHLAQWAVGEIESLRHDLAQAQERVKELEEDVETVAEKLSNECAASLRLMKELAALKAKQGEPVIFRAYNTAQSCWEYGEEDELAQMPYTLLPPEKLYTSAPSIQQGKPVAWIPTDALDQLKAPRVALLNVPLVIYEAENYSPLYTSAPTIPEGWQLVPIELTDEMFYAGDTAFEGGYVYEVYEAMLDAAPKYTKETE